MYGKSRFTSFMTWGFSYSVLSVKKSTIEKDPEAVQSFTDAMIEALAVVQTDKEPAKKNLIAEFPTLSDDAIQAPWTGPMPTISGAWTG